MKPDMYSILVVEDDNNFRMLVSDILIDEGYRVQEADNGKTALKILKNNPPIDLVLLDLRLPDMSGLEVLEKAIQNYPDVLFIMLSAHGDIQTAIKAVKMGAYDFLEKPVSSERLILTIQRALDYLNIQKEKKLLLEETQQRYQLVCHSKAMLEILAIVDKVAKTDVTVLITGESGTGKEMIARAIHRNSSRAKFPFVQLNCAAIPDNLIESELFGHVKGAFTGAQYSHKGKFQLAQNGTLFLDEIGDLSPAAQAKVLLAIETGEITRVGGEKVEKVDVRLIVATNRNLEDMIKQGEFREDLYHRINVVSIHVPPLRERIDDIIPLAEYFLEYFANLYHREKPYLTPDAQAFLLSYRWPGNVRELRNLMEKIIILTDHNEIHGRDVSNILNAKNHAEVVSELTYYEARRTFERTFLIEQLNRHGWNISKTAQAIGIERAHLYKIMKRLGIETH
ncbi:MAG TPA: sigma-54-dependent Fis family transcriptional regulator [Bacteroidetes bacterium]|nr:sigma-54-dependent Fis family transcriptional regulator [Bacteroidota bacterium]